MPALSFAIELLTSLPSLISAGIDVTDLISNANRSLKTMKDEDRGPSDEEWASLNDIIAELRAQRPDV